MRKLSAGERKSLNIFMVNPFYRDVIENAPNERCRDYIIYGLIHGTYCGYDPEKCKAHLEVGLTVNDWGYIKQKLAGNNPFLLKCINRIKEQKKGNEGML